MLPETGVPAPQEAAAVPVAVGVARVGAGTLFAAAPPVLFTVTLTVICCPAVTIVSVGEAEESKACTVPKLRAAGLTALTTRTLLSAHVLLPGPEQPPLDGVPLTLTVRLPLEGAAGGVTVHVIGLLSEFAAREKAAGFAVLVQPEGTERVTVTPVHETPGLLWMIDGTVKACETFMVPSVAPVGAVI